MCLQRIVCSSVALTIINICFECLTTVYTISVLRGSHKLQCLPLVCLEDHIHGQCYASTNHLLGNKMSILILKVPVTTVDALRHFETG